MLWLYEAPAEVWGAATTEGVVFTSSDDNVVHAVTASTGELLWQREGFGLAAVSDGVVYAGFPDEERLYALEATTGEVLWEREGFGLAAVSDGVVYVGMSEGQLHARDASTGELLWQYEALYEALEALMVGRPAVSDGVVYVGSWDPAVPDDGLLHALTASTGELLWEYEAQVFWPVVVDGVVYIGSGNDGLDALDASTGELLWKYD